MSRRRRFDSLDKLIRAAQDFRRASDAVDDARRKAENGYAKASLVKSCDEARAELFRILESVQWEAAATRAERIVAEKEGTRSLLAAFNMKRPQEATSEAHRFVRFAWAEINRERLSYLEVAERAGVAESALRKWRNGSRVPTLWTIEAVLNVLGYGVEIRRL